MPLEFPPDALRVKYLEFLQQIISRMAGNSFQLRQWSVGISTAVFAFASRDSDHPFVLIAVLPALAFWFLDAYFLSLEKHYRQRFDRVRKAELEELKKEPFDLSPPDRLAGQWLGSLFRPAALGVHGMVLLVLAIAIAYWFRVDPLTP